MATITTLSSLANSESRRMAIMEAAMEKMVRMIQAQDKKIEDQGKTIDNLRQRLGLVELGSLADYQLDSHMQESKYHREY